MLAVLAHFLKHFDYFFPAFHADTTQRRELLIRQVQHITKRLAAAAQESVAGPCTEVELLNRGTFPFGKRCLNQKSLSS